MVDTPTPAIRLLQFSFDKMVSVKLYEQVMTMRSRTRNQINAQKLLLSKWTDVNPQAKEKHFLVTKLIDPEQPKNLIELVELEAVLTKRRFAMRWAELTDATKWRQGWQ